MIKVTKQQLLILMLLALSCSGCAVRAEAPMEHPQPYPSKTTGKEALKPSDGEDYWGYSDRQYPERNKEDKEDSNGSHK